MTPLPEARAVLALKKIGGVVEVASYAGCDATEATARAAIADALARATTDWNARLRAEGVRRHVRTDPARLAGIQPRALTRAAFLGAWWDDAAGTLVRKGTWEVDGRRLVDPTTRDLRGRRPISGGGPIPSTFEGGNLAYAATRPPYGMNADPDEVERVFRGLLFLLLPPGEVTTILDWSDAALPEVSDVLRCGAEWWGVFLWTVHHAGTGCLHVAYASATD